MPRFFDVLMFLFSLYKRFSKFIDIQFSLFFTRCESAYTAPKMYKCSKFFFLFVQAFLGIKEVPPRFVRRRLQRKFAISIASTQKLTSRLLFISSGPFIVVKVLQHCLIISFSLCIHDTE